MPLRIATWLRLAVIAFALCAPCACVGCAPEAASLDSGRAVAEPFVVAVAGADAVVVEGAVVGLSAFGSRPLGATSALTWRQIEGPSVTLSSASGLTPAFVAPVAPATLRFVLTVDADGRTDTDSVTVNVVAAGEDLKAVRPVGHVVMPGDVLQTGRTTIAVSAIDGDANLSREAVLQLVEDVPGACPRVTLDRGQVIVPGNVATPCVVVVEGSIGSASLTRANVVIWPPSALLPASPSLTAPLSVAPSAEVGLRFQGEGVVLWHAPGRANLPLAEATEATRFVAPASVERLVLAFTREQLGVRSAVNYAAIDVSAVNGNVAPRASAGPDRIVPPGGRFALDGSASSDRNRDTLAVRFVQVAGPTATAVDAVTFEAPAVDNTLLFWAIANDGQIDSHPDTVRVVVSASAANVPPVIDVPAAQFVTPTTPFTLRVIASDPDSGVIAATTISQDTGDEHVLLPSPVNAASATLTSGVAGEVYHFTLTARDDAGLVSSAEVAITVEAAGPYVDVERGSDATGTGEASAPLASLAAAIPVARRHGFALRLAGGDYALPAPSDVDVDIEGGFEPVNGDYVAGTATTRLVPAGAMTVSGELADVDVLLGSEATLLLVDRAAIRRGELHVDTTAQASLLVNGDGVRLEQVTLTLDGAPSDASLISLMAGAFLSLVDAQLSVGSAVANATALRCDGAAFVATRTAFAASQNSTGASVALMLDHCAATLVDSEVTGGGGVPARAVVATQSAVALDANTVVWGRTSGQGEAAGVILNGGAETSVLRGQIGARRVATLSAAPLELTSIALASARVTLEDLTVVAPGDGTGLFVASGVVDADGMDLAHDAVGAGISVWVSDARVSLAGSALTTDTAFSLDSTAVLHVVASTIAASSAIAVGTGNVTFEDSALHCAGEAGCATALSAARVSLVRTSLQVEGNNSVGIAAAAVELDAAFVDVAGAGTHAVDVSSGDVVVVQSTLRAARGLSATSSGLISNSVFDAPSGLVVLGGALSGVTASAFIDTIVVGATVLNTPAAFAARGCAACMRLENVSTLIDATGHLLATDSPLIDAGFVSPTPAFDIDGELRVGPPDLGCDELSAPL